LNFPLFSVAFSSNFIPRIIHDFSEDLKNVDYLEFTLAYFDVKDFDKQSKPNSTDHEICRYPEFRNPPSHEHPYKRPGYYWKILAARLAFIIIFQNIVAWLQQFIDWAIPDKPEELDSRIKRENYLVSNKIIREEKNKILRSSRYRMDEVDYVNGGVYFEAKS
jgi:anoctamin-1